MEGNLDKVKRLVGVHVADGGGGDLSAFVNAQDPSGNSAVIGAVFSGHLDLLSVLAESCGSGDDDRDGNGGGGVDLTIKNGLGCSPLWVAAGYDRVECLEYLVDKLRASNKLESALLDANSTGDTPFVAAVSRGNVGACRALLKSAEKCDDCWEMKRKMLRTANNGGDTALKVAVANGHGEELLTLLLEADDLCSEHPVDPSTEDAADDEEEDPLRSKCVNRKNNSGLSPLIIACERNLPLVAELLLRHGADLSIRDAMGRNSLAVAAFCGCNDVVEFLLNKTEAKALLLDDVDQNGCTPLWLLARTGNVSMVKLLMDAGADASIKDNEGLSPHDVAVKFKKEKVEEYFQQQKE
jgi:ankyrin repeat protein